MQRKLIIAAIVFIAIALFIKWKGKVTIQTGTIAGPQSNDSPYLKDSPANIVENVKLDEKLDRLYAWEKSHPGETPEYDENGDPIIP